MNIAERMSALALLDEVTPLPWRVSQIVEPGAVFSADERAFVQVDVNGELPEVIVDQLAAIVAVAVNEWVVRSREVVAEHAQLHPDLPTADELPAGLRPWMAMMLLADNGSGYQMRECIRRLRHVGFERGEFPPTDRVLTKWLKAQALPAAGAPVFPAPCTDNAAVLS